MLQPLQTTLDLGLEAPGPAPAAARSGCWIAVASADHVARGRAEGFMQVCHGKPAPLRRLRPGDRVVYYSPTRTIGGREPVRAFTALGTVKAGEPFLFDMGGGFVPWRRAVDWSAADAAPIAPLLPLMAWTSGQRHWAYPLRFGLFAISRPDLHCIAQAMGAA